MKLRGGTRCKMALTVVSTSGRFLSAADGSSSTPSAVMRFATISELGLVAIVRERVSHDGNGDDANIRREECDRAPAVHRAAGRRAPRADAMPGRSSGARPGDLRDDAPSKPSGTPRYGASDFELSVVDKSS